MTVQDEMKVYKKNMQVYEITLLLNDKHDDIPSRICRECQFYSQSDSYY